MDRQLHCLGTAGYHPNDQRQTSCYFLPQDGVVLDAGTGVYRLTPLIQTDSLDILLSHAHLDHVVGLTFLLEVFHLRPVRDVRVWGTAQKLDVVQRLLFDESLFPVKLPVQWCPIDDLPTFEIGSEGNITVQHRPQEHPGSSVAYRLDWQTQTRSLVYATDTVGDETPDHSSWIHDADLLIHECSFTDDQIEWAVKTGHCWTSRAATIARKGNVKKLLLTHINPANHDHDPVQLEVAKAIFDNTEVAVDRQVVNF